MHECVCISCRHVFHRIHIVFKRSTAIVQTCTTNVKVYLCNSARISPNHCEKC